MTNAENDEPDTLTRSDQKLRDLLTIRSYLRDRVDELVAAGILLGADVVAVEVSRLNKAIAKAEAEAAQ
jgi:hypothetical protein